MKKKALKAAFPYTIPIFAGFLFLGIAYGIYMNTAGFSFWYPMLIGLLVYGGSLEFVIVTLLLAPFSPLATFILAFLIQIRHLFYGISMLEPFKDLDWKKYYIIFGMCDETFSINYAASIPDDVDRGWFLFWVTILNHIYWVAGATLGGLLGTIIPFKTDGLEFVLTALFFVIFLENWKKEKHHTPSYIGLTVSFLCLLIFGPDYFLLPSMTLILLLLTLLRHKLDKQTQENSL